MSCRPPHDSRASTRARARATSTTAGAAVRPRRLSAVRAATDESRFKARRSPATRCHCRCLCRCRCLCYCLLSSSVSARRHLSLALRVPTGIVLRETCAHALRVLEELVGAVLDAGRLWIELAHGHTVAGPARHGHGTGRLRELAISRAHRLVFSGASVLVATPPCHDFPLS